MTTGSRSSPAVAARATQGAWLGRLHWVEYGLEALQLGLFMLAACFAVAALEHPASPLRERLTEAWLRRVMVGLAMGSTAVALVYSPWGKRSGAHMNPAVTLAFLRLGKMSRLDAALYVAAQFLGASLGMLVAAFVLGPVLAHANVSFVVTVPQPGGVARAFAAETCISGGLMLVVLWASNSERFRDLTGVFCGALVAAYISVEAPLSGMSMNPARTFGSALVAARFDSLWVYLVAPPLGMWLVAEAYARRSEERRRACAKLQHDGASHCIFCASHPRTSSQPSVSGAENHDRNSSV